MSKNDHIRVPLAICGLLLLAVLSGCGGDRLSPAALAARKALQFERAQEALDKLSAEPVDDTLEGHYLRAIALERLERLEAANAEAKIAVDRAPKNPKYQGLVLRLKLFAGEITAIEPLLELHDQHPSSAAVSLCAIYAFQAKSVRQRSDGKFRAAKVQLEKAEAGLQTAVSLASEIPECQNELISMSMWFERPDDALKLLDGLLREEPDNIDFLRNRAKVLVMAKKSAEAISAASLLYRRLERTERAAVELANTLIHLPPSPAVLEQYASLRESFPQNLPIQLRHCWSLGNSRNGVCAAARLATQTLDRSSGRGDPLGNGGRGPDGEAAQAIPHDDSRQATADLSRRAVGLLTEGLQLELCEDELRAGDVSQGQQHVA